MIRFFKSAFPAQYIAIFLIGILLWGRAFIQPPAMPVVEGFVPFYSFTFSMLAGVPIVATLGGFIITIISAFLLNTLLTQSDVIQKNSSIAGFLFIILTGFHPLLLTLHPGNISLFFLLLILRQLFASYGQEEAYDSIYSAGFFIAFGSLFYFPLIVFFGFIPFSFIFIRPANWREWVASFLGFITPFIFLSVYYFWNDLFLTKWKEILSFEKLHLHFQVSGNLFFLVVAGFIGFLSLIVFLYVFSKTTERTIEIRRKSLLINWIILFAAVSSIFSSKISLYHSVIFFIPITSLMSIYLLSLKRLGRQELLILIYLLAIVLNNLVFQFH